MIFYEPKGERGGVLNNTLYGKALPRRPTPYHFICTIFDRKGPLLFTFSHKWYPLDIPSLELCIPLTAVNLLSFKYDYYSFKIFPRFWMAKSTLIIHHNQLLMTKFGRILCLTRKWLQKCSPLQVKANLGRGWVVLVVKKKMAHISLVSRVRTTAGTRRNNS